ncbi:hypothetical protein LRAMOSA03339 [Lichtheimia ramosa]|uniref:SCP2 domain-containing protein n=1 Tax=Lichtheimia ramosa TaxID=688394 RepID=A0A077WUT5_9FUNG|nr:hypothetical protein LRAMOSA03339 [Lichtheimia ramosa]
MSDIVVPGFKSSELIAEMSDTLDAFSEEERANFIQQVNGVIEFVIKKDGETEAFYFDVKKQGEIARGKGHRKPDAIITLADHDFVALAQGKTNGQKAYMSGRIKIKGQIMLAMNLETIFQTIYPGYGSF